MLQNSYQNDQQLFNLFDNIVGNIHKGKEFNKWTKEPEN